MKLSIGPPTAEDRTALPPRREACAQDRCLELATEQGVKLPTTNLAKLTRLMQAGKRTRNLKRLHLEDLRHHAERDAGEGGRSTGSRTNWSTTAPEENTATSKALFAHPAPQAPPELPRHRGPGDRRPARRGRPQQHVHGRDHLRHPPRWARRSPWSSPNWRSPTKAAACSRSTLAGRRRTTRPSAPRVVRADPQEQHQLDRTRGRGTVRPGEHRAGAALLRRASHRPRHASSRTTACSATCATTASRSRCACRRTCRRASPRRRRHPVRRWLPPGLRVTLNTDNRLMSATTVSDEIELAVKAFNLSPDEIKAHHHQRLQERVHAVPAGEGADAPRSEPRDGSHLPDAFPS